MAQLSPQLEERLQLLTNEIVRIIRERDTRVEVIRNNPSKTIQYNYHITIFSNHSSSLFYCFGQLLLLLLETASTLIRIADQKELILFVLIESPIINQNY